MRLVRALALALVGALLVSTPTQAAAPAPARAAKPNVVFVYVDDMSLQDLRYMDYTRNLFAQHGTTFTNAISPNPLCCPARAIIQTGQYSQNNGVHYNRGFWGGFDAFSRAGMQRLFPQWFRSDGYSTAYVGKYLNGYKEGNIPGVDVTETLVKNVYAPYDFTTWNNGDPQVRGKHTTTWTGFRTAGLIDQFAGAPFQITTAFLAPHAMKKNGDWVPPYERKMKRHLRSLDPGDEIPWSLDKPSFNEPDMSDKPTPVRGKDPIPVENVRSAHEGRVLSLYKVDSEIERIVGALKANGVYSNTVLAFTSDNGFLMGEHRIKDKDQPYAESLRVPFMVLGPGVPAGQVNDNVVTTVDMPGTMAALAGVTPNRVQDGINAFDSTPDRAVLIESGSETEAFDWRGVYTRDLTYVKHSTGEREFYDRTTDPFEIDSQPGDPRTDDLAALLTRLIPCSGDGCRATY